MSLLQFLKTNTEQLEKSEFKVQIMGRLEGQEPFVCRTISSEEYNEIQKLVTNPKGKIDISKLTTLIVVKSCIEPKFNDVKLMKELNCVTPTDLVKKLLTVGEINSLATSIIEESGLNVDAVVLEKEVKN